jgi:competence protein ComGC
MPIVFHYYHSPNHGLQDIKRIWRSYRIIYLIICIFLLTLPKIAYNNDMIIQQGDKVYQCIGICELTFQAYPVVINYNSSIIEDYRSHGYSCDPSSYGPICPYGQTPKVSPNYLEAFVCKQNDPEGADLCHYYAPVLFNLKSLSSLIYNCILDQYRLANDEYAGTAAAIQCLWKRCIWITVPECDVTHQ